MQIAWLINTFLFQSTYLYKVRPTQYPTTPGIRRFNPRTYIRYDYTGRFVLGITDGFNPRTYIRYDLMQIAWLINTFLFQSTYLYKVRRFFVVRVWGQQRFQSTYLYKVRLGIGIRFIWIKSFNPRTYIRYDKTEINSVLIVDCFNPRTYIRYDTRTLAERRQTRRFNPRTYIRYDFAIIFVIVPGDVSIHVPI